MELLALPVLAAIYFLPFIIALIRGHQSKLAVFFANLFFGWTLIGWIICFIWAFTKGSPTVVQVHQTVVTGSSNNVGGAEK